MGEGNFNSKFLVHKQSEQNDVSINIRIGNWRFDQSVISYRAKLGEGKKKKRKYSKHATLPGFGDWNITCKHSTKSCNRLDRIKGGNYDQSKRTFFPSFAQLSFDSFFFFFKKFRSRLVNEIGEIIESNLSSHPRISGASKLKSIERLYNDVLVGTLRLVRKRRVGTNWNYNYAQLERERERKGGGRRFDFSISLAASVKRIPRR